MKERIAKMQETMAEIVSRANTPATSTLELEVEEVAPEMNQRSCLSGGRGQHQLLHESEHWHQSPPVPMLSARAAPVAVIPVRSIRLEPLALEQSVTSLSTRLEWANSLGSPLSTPVKVIASLYRKMTSDPKETKAS